MYLNQFVSSYYIDLMPDKISEARNNAKIMYFLPLNIHIRTLSINFYILFVL